MGRSPGVQVVQVVHAVSIRRGIVYDGHTHIEDTPAQV